MKALLIVLLVFRLYSETNSVNLSDLAKSAGDAVKGIAEKIPDVIPKPEDIFQGGKNLIAGYPFQALFSAINQFC